MDTIIISVKGGVAELVHAPAHAPTIILRDYDHIQTGQDTVDDIIHKNNSTVLQKLLIDAEEACQQERAYWDRQEQDEVHREPSWLAELEQSVANFKNCDDFQQAND